MGNASWRTNLAGWLTIVVGILNFALQFLGGQGVDPETIGISATALVAGGGLLNAKDQQVSGLPTDAPRVV